ncbi:MAG: hypothetical protein WB587_15190 [Nitrososphaeraceae archaeon]
MSIDPNNKGALEEAASRSRAKYCELLVYKKSKILHNTMNAVVDLKNSTVLINEMKKWIKLL